MTDHVVVPTRHPAVGGTFYPSLPGRLRADLRTYMSRAQPPRHAYAVLAPHPALLYGGHVGGAVFGALHVPDTVVILSPNHTGRGTAIEGGSILLGRAYRTPLGDVQPDLALGHALVERASPLLVEDLVAHAHEHGIEVLLPFLQMRNPRVSIVPIIVGWKDWARSRTLAAAIAETVGDRDVLVIASSDLTHYESAAEAEAKDSLALDQIVALDGEGLFREVALHRITMCGVAATATACEYARLRGATSGELVSYSHSGVVNGDTHRVVAYAGALLGVR